jgi:hypothetical protein
MSDSVVLLSPSLVVVFRFFPLECATLLRYFGIRAVVVDFPSSSAIQQHIFSKSTSSMLQQPSITSRIRTFISHYFQDVGDDSSNGSTDSRSSSTKNLENEINSFKFPLYFQHLGHSRTIVGIERTDSAATVKNNNSLTNLIIFDPAVDADSLLSSLRSENCSWKKNLLKPLESLNNKKSYQIVYVSPGIMSPEERERSKLIVGEQYDSPLKLSL